MAEGERLPRIRLSIVIVSYNVRDLLSSCLRSIDRTLAGTPREVIVVDNASSDGTVEMMVKEFPTVLVIPNPFNIGFCKANNQGIALARGDYVMLLNPDTEVQPRAVDQMIQYLSLHEDVWAVGPDLPQPLDPIDVLACGYQPNLRRAFNQYFFLTALRPTKAAFQGINLYRKGGYTSATDVEWISGACILTRASVLSRIGGLDETIFLYTDDFEWCQRVVVAGGKIAYLPSAVVTHFANSSTKKVRYRALWTWSGIWIEYFRRINGLLPAVVFGVMVTLGHALRGALAGARLVATCDWRYAKAIRTSLEISIFTGVQIPLVLVRATKRRT